MRRKIKKEVLSEWYHPFPGDNRMKYTQKRPKFYFLYRPELYFQKAYNSVTNNSLHPHHARIELGVHLFIA